MLLLVASPALANSEEKKVNICQEQEDGTYKAKAVDSDSGWEENAHNFLYGGTLKDNGQPENKDKAADQWCEDNIPTNPYCLNGENIDVAINKETPEGATAGECPPVVVTPPVETPKTTPTELPNTGGGLEWLLFGLGTSGIGVGLKYLLRRG